MYNFVEHYLLFCSAASVCTDQFIGTFIPFYRSHKIEIGARVLLKHLYSHIRIPLVRINIRSHGCWYCFENIAKTTQLKFCFTEKPEHNSNVYFYTNALKFAYSQNRQSRLLSTRNMALSSLHPSHQTDRFIFCGKFITGYLNEASKQE